MVNLQQRSPFVHARRGIGRVLSAALASLLTFGLALGAPTVAQAAPEVDPTVSWSIFFDSPVTATANGVAFASGDTVSLNSEVVFEIKLRNGYTYQEPPATTGCDVEYTGSSGGTDFWKIAQVTADCDVSFFARWILISPVPYELEPELVLGEPYAQQFRSIYGYGPFEG